VPPSVERSTYVLSASFALPILYWQWQPVPALIWTVHNPTAAAVLVGIFRLGWVVLVASTFLLSHFELFGLSQVFARLFGNPMNDQSTDQSGVPVPRFAAPAGCSMLTDTTVRSTLVALPATRTNVREESNGQKLRVSKCLPSYPSKRTSLNTVGMSQKCRVEV
jgi:hypothetical protein